MKQLLILSGKGGTGKTTVAGAFIKLSNVKAYADCDIDAPNLHLIMEQESKPEHYDYYGLDKAVIDNDKCVECNLCYENCRFDAINKDDGYTVEIYDCEGCGVCEAICPSSAISMVPYKAGDMTLYREPKVFSTAELKMGSGNSGLLVTEVKKNMKRKNKKHTYTAATASATALRRSLTSAMLSGPSGSKSVKAPTASARASSRARAPTSSTPVGTAGRGTRPPG